MCPPLICGLTSSILQVVYPDSVLNQRPVSLGCSSANSLEGDDANAQVVLGLLTKLAADRLFWKRVGIGLGIVCVLLVAGLGFALIR
jgi:hypothetical protein